MTSFRNDQTNSQTYQENITGQLVYRLLLLTAQATVDNTTMQVYIFLLSVATMLIIITPFVIRSYINIVRINVLKVNLCYPLQRRQFKVNSTVTDHHESFCKICNRKKEKIPTQGQHDFYNSYGKLTCIVFWIISCVCMFLYILLKQQIN